MQVYQTVTLVLAEQEARDLWLEVAEIEALAPNTRTGLALIRGIRDQLTARGLGPVWAAPPDPGQQTTARVVAAAQGRPPSGAPG